MVTYIGRDNYGAFAPLLQEDSFSKAQKKNRVIWGCVDEGAACGVLELGVTEESAVIENIYVARDFRLKGHGSALLDKAMEFAAERGIPEIEIHYDPGRHTNINVLLFKGGFMIDSDSKTFTSSLDELFASFDFNKRPAPAKVLPLSEIPQGMINSFCGSSDDFFFDPIDLSESDGDISAAVMEQDKLLGAVWASGGQDGITVDGMYFLSARAGAEYVFPIIAVMLQAAKKKYPGDIPVRFVAVNPTIESITKKLFPGVSFTNGYILCQKRVPLL